MELEVVDADQEKDKLGSASIIERNYSCPLDMLPGLRYFKFV